MSRPPIHPSWCRALLAASLLSCVLGCGGSQVADNPWGWPPLAPRDTIVARVDVAPGARVRAHALDNRWRSGTVTGVANDTLFLADGRPAIPLRGLRLLEVNTGEQVHSGSRMFGLGLAGFLLGGLAGAAILTIVDPCGPSTGNPDADICLDGLVYLPVGAAVGAVVGLAIGAQPVDRWVTVFPVRAAFTSPSPDSRRLVESWRARRD